MSDTYVHPTAVVDEGAQIGPGSKVWHFSHIMPKAVIGTNCNLGQNVFVADGVRIGNNVKIQNNVSVYEGVILEDDVFCGPSMVFTNVTTPRSAFPRNTASDYASTKVGRGASIGANATIVCGHNIGSWALVGAGSVITADVPSFACMVGVPAKQIGWVCKCGERLADQDKDFTCSRCGRTYTLSDGILSSTDHLDP